jgi:putative transposase
MPRFIRAAVPDTIHHVLNRGNGRGTLFPEPSNYEAFVALMAKAVERFPVALLAYCLMPNHWHMVVRPAREGALSAYVHWLATTHVRQHHARHGTNGTGHLYQGRFKNFLVQDDAHLMTVLRYVEANALRAGLVARAEYWPWGSLRARTTGCGGAALAQWPLTCPTDWMKYVNFHTPESDLRDLRRSAARGLPFGSESWTARMVAQHRMEALAHRRGRPRRTQPHTQSFR